MAHGGGPAPESGGWQAPILSPGLPFLCSQEVSRPLHTPMGASSSTHQDQPSGPLTIPDGMWLVPCNLPSLVWVGVERRREGAQVCISCGHHHCLQRTAPHPRCSGMDQRFTVTCVNHWDSSGCRLGLGYLGIHSSRRVRLPVVQVQGSSSEDQALGGIIATPGGIVTGRGTRTVGSGQPCGSVHS